MSSEARVFDQSRFIHQTSEGYDYLNEVSSGIARAKEGFLFEAPDTIKNGYLHIQDSCGLEALAYAVTKHNAKGIYFDVDALQDKDIGINSIVGRINEIRFSPLKVNYVVGPVTDSVAESKIVHQGGHSTLLGFDQFIADVETNLAKATHSKPTTIDQQTEITRKLRNEKLKQEISLPDNARIPTIVDGVVYIDRQYSKEELIYALATTDIQRVFIDAGKIKEEALWPLAIEINNIAHDMLGHASGIIISAHGINEMSQLKIADECGLHGMGMTLDSFDQYLGKRRVTMQGMDKRLTNWTESIQLGRNNEQDRIARH